MLIIQRGDKQVSSTRESINLFAMGRRVVCIRNLSELKRNIKESYVEEEFPYIGKTYLITSCRVLDAKKSRFFNLNLAEFEMEEDDMGQQMTFKSCWFVPEQFAYNVLLCSNINIRLPGFKEKLAYIYEKGLWKPKKS